MIYSGSGPAGTPVDFDWHPSGARIAFYAPYRNWMINSDGTGLRQISPDAAFVSYENMTFSPDGTRLSGARSHRRLDERAMADGRQLRRRPRGLHAADHGELPRQRLRPGLGAGALARRLPEGVVVLHDA